MTDIEMARECAAAHVITQDDIDMAKKAVLAATVDIVDGNRGGLDWLAKIFAEHRIAQIERDAALLEDMAFGFRYAAKKQGKKCGALTIGVEHAAKAIRDQAPSPLQNGGVG